MFRKTHSHAYYEHQKAELQKQKELFDKEAEIREIKKNMRRWKAPETSKLFAALLFANFGIVEIYCMVAMWYFGNLDAISVLITTILAEPLTLATYCAKAFAGKKQEEAVKLERDKMAMGMTREDNAESEDNPEENDNESVSAIGFEYEPDDEEDDFDIDETIYGES